jgi:hypothetical protein
MEEMIDGHNILVGKRQGKRRLGKHRRRWEHNNITDLREIGWMWNECIRLRIGTSGRPL